MRIEIFVLTLASQSQRSRALSDRLESYGFDFKFLDAFDGRKLDLSHFPLYDESQARNYMGRNLVGGEIGCYLSHLKAAEKLLRSDADCAIVLEDDAAPDEHLICASQNLVKELNRVDPDWLLVNIGKSSDKLNTDIAPVPGHHNLLQAAHYFPVTTHGLLWSRRGAEKFLQDHTKIWAPVDNYFRHWLTREGHGYAVHPPLVGVTGAESEIAPSTQGQKRQDNGRTWHFALSKQKRLFVDKLIAARNRARFSQVRRDPSV